MTARKSERSSRKEENLSAGLLRQRRNLIAISLFLVVFDFAHVTVEKVSILGTELLVGDPRILAALAWVVWGYFCLRLLRYLLAEPYFTSDLRTQFNYRLQLYSQRWIQARIKRDFPTQDTGQPLRIAPARIGRRWVVSGLGYNPATGREEVVDKKVTSIWRYWWWALRALFHMTFFTTYVTDFILPVLLAVAAPIVNCVTLTSFKKRHVPQR
jgi:hypothetical protein